MTAKPRRKLRFAAASLLMPTLLTGLATSNAATAAAEAKPGAGYVEPSPIPGTGQIPASLPRVIQDPDEPFDPAEAAATAAFFGISQTAAKDRLAAENEASRLEELITRRYPNETAGVWLDIVGSTDIHVAFAGDDAAARSVEARAASERPDWVVGHVLKHSLASLKATQDRIGAERADAARGSEDIPAAMRASRGHYDLDIDVRTNRIKVRTHYAGRDRLQAEMRGRYAEHLDVVAGATGPACLRTDCRYTMRGGLQLDLDTGGYCTAAFAAHGVSTGNPFVLTAAHCQGTQRRNGGSHYGSLNGTGEMERDRVDAERVPNDPGGLVWQDSSSIYLDPGVFRTINGYTAHSGQTVGTQVGKSGATTGQTRGLIASKTFRPTHIPNGYDFVSSNDLCIQPGDSGGPVFRNNSAYGIVSGSSLNADGTYMSCGQSGYLSVYGAINFALSGLSLALTYGQ